MPIRHYVRRVIRHANVVPAPPLIDWNDMPLQAQQQAVARQMPANIALDKLPIKKKFPKEPSRALPNGRQKNVKLRDILKAYKQADNLLYNRFVIIDFRPVRVGEYFLGKSFKVEMGDRQTCAQLKNSLRIILEHIKAEQQLQDDYI